MTEQGSASAAVGTLPDAAEVPQRRCWRCLQMFAGDPLYVPRRAEFWLCETCEPMLLGGAVRRPS